MSSHQAAGQIHYRIKVANKSFEDMAEFRYLGTAVTNQNCFNMEIMSRLNSGNAWYMQFRIFCLPFCYIET
jgi:hypothetical protein